MKLITVFIPGAAKTKGSMKHVGNGNMVESVAGSTAWKRIMTGLLRSAYQRAYSAPYAGPCTVVADVYLDCTAERLIEEGSGDTDKLMRNVMDALQQAGVYLNDAQVVDERLRKWAWPRPEHEGQGVSVTVYAGRIP